MHYYTSITSNYLPKARTLAESVKRHDPVAVFHLLLTDTPPQGWNLSDEPFDTVLHLEDLGIPNPRGWAFKHALVEMCTAVKGPGALEIIRRHQPSKLVYFDPDIVVFGGLDTLEAALDEHAILLTPHLTDPENSDRGILDNEISALRHGIFNLGFLAARCDGEGMRCLRWWSERLIKYCRDDIPNGLFTDQRWADHMPALFNGVHILRSPAFNVATWNLSNRKATGTAPDRILVNGVPLGFYHFSGFDSGAQEAMLDVYGHDSPVLKDLRQWYIKRCMANGQDSLGKHPCAYARFSNGEPILKAHRILYRERADLQAAFPDPFDTSDVNRSYWHWFEANAESELAHPAGESSAVAALAVAQDELRRTRQTLALMQASRGWQWAQRLSRLVARFR